MGRASHGFVCRDSLSCPDPVVSDDPEESPYRDLDLGSCHDDEGPTLCTADRRVPVNRLQTERPLSENKKMSLTPGHRLLPHERWFDSSTLERQQAHRTLDILLIEPNYGPKE